MTTMSKPIELSKSQWAKLYEQLKKDYPPSVMLIRNKMRSKLGFVDREQKEKEFTWRALKGEVKERDYNDPPF
jgi:hypothetical protein